MKSHFLPSNMSCAWHVLFFGRKMWMELDWDGIGGFLDS